MSAAILRRLEDYRRVLESYSAPLRSFVDWRATENGNVAVLNETADYYRYFDATAHAEFLYQSVAQTVEHDLPDEVCFLEAFDRFAAGVKESRRCRTGRSSACPGSSSRPAGVCRRGRATRSSRRSPTPRVAPFDAIALDVGGLSPPLP